MADKPALNPTARIAKNSLVQLAAGVLNKALGVALVIYAARQLGADGFGQYMFVLSLLAVFYIITDFGLGVLATRDLSQYPEREAVYFGNLVLMRLLLSVLAAAGMVGAAAVLGHSSALVWLAGVAAGSLFFSSNVDTCSAIFYAHQRMEVPATLSVAANTLRVAASLGALAAGAGVNLLLWIFTASTAVHFFLLFGALLAHTRPVFRPDRAFWGSMLRAAAPLALANIFSVIYFRVDTLMLAAMVGEQAVGLYNAAYRLLEFTLILPAYYAGAIFPVVSSSVVEHPRRFQLIYRRSMKYMLTASLPLALGTSALAPKFIHVLYGASYAASVPVLTILMWTLVLIAMNSINAPYLIAMGRQRTVTVLTLVSMLVNIGLNALAIPRYGMVGAAWVTLFSEVVNVVLFMGILVKPLALTGGLLRQYLRPLVAGAAMVGALALVPRWDLGFQILLGAAVYIGVLFVVRTFDEVDAELFNRVLRPTQPGSQPLT